MMDNNLSNLLQEALLAVFIIIMYYIHKRGKK